jgi:hypothetical protein
MEKEPLVNARTFFFLLPQRSAFPTPRSQEQMEAQASRQETAPTTES